MLTGFFFSVDVAPPRDLTLSFASDFQNFLRTQTGNTTTVNIIISTVDYLLRLQVGPPPQADLVKLNPAINSFLFPSIQESISDFYWYYSGKDVIDEAGQRNFSRALAVAKQVFNSLTEYIQVAPVPILERNPELRRI